jgi:hypothetical protein
MGSENSYPKMVVLGEVPYQTTYELQPDQLLLDFQKNFDKELVDALLKKLNLEPTIDPKDKIKTDNLLPTMRWVHLAKRPEALAQFARELLKNYGKRLKMVCPVYYAKGEGSESAIAPSPNAILVRFKESTEKKGIETLKRKFRLEYHQIMSKLLEPFHKFILISAQNNDDKSKKMKGSNVKSRPQFDPFLGEPSEVFSILEKVLEDPMVDLAEMDWLKFKVLEAVPNDTFWANQWNMARIGMVDAWDEQTGDPTICIAIIDNGCDLTHPDLVFTPNTSPNFTHFNAAEADAGNLPPYDANPSPPADDPNAAHGSLVAGLAAAAMNNNAGIAGLAGGCQIMPLKIFPGALSSYLAAAIDWARLHNADVINMSLSSSTISDVTTALNNAWNAGMVLCAASGNYYLDYEPVSAPVKFPARHANVIAVGASDQNDERKRPTSADGEEWGSHYGSDLDVVAPGQGLWSTDIQGTDGWNSNNGGAIIDWFGVNYPSSGDATGDYFALMGGTSGACPHVSGLAALLLLKFPGLTNQQIRDIIERTCEKVSSGMYPYAHTPNRPNGNWHEHMGYGRINALRALDFADVMIKDFPNDTGIEPSTPPGGNYWDFSDIVIRPIDDNVFVPSDPNQSAIVTKGQTNYLYIMVTNNGPKEAKNVVVTARITPFVGISFVYPADWTLIDATHVSPTPMVATFASIPSGGTEIAKFTISSLQVDSLWGWEHNMNWSPCLLASVNSDNDYAFATAALTGGSLVRRCNNLVQRNLSIVDIMGGEIVRFPFIAGNKQDDDSFMEIIINRSRLPKDVPLLLSLEDDGKAFPLVDFSPPPFVPSEKRGKFVFLEGTRIEIALACIHGVLTLEKGSSFECPSFKLGKVSVKGGEIILRKDTRFVDIRDNIASVRIEKQPKQLYPMCLHLSIPMNAKAGQQYPIQVAQRNNKEEMIGGATVIYFLK